MKKVQKKNRKTYCVQQAKDALHQIQAGMSVRKASMRYGVPRTTLQDLKKGLYDPDSRPGPSPFLTTTEEKLLCDWLIEMSRRGIPVSQKCLLDSIQKILSDDGRDHPFAGNRPGRTWFNAFMKRHQQLAQRSAESICRSRGALTEKCIKGWFKDAEKFFKQRAIEYVLSDSQRQYNGDETGFLLDPKCGKVVAPRGQVIYTEAGGQKEQVTVLVTTRADGKVMKSAIVYPYKRAVPKPIVDTVPDCFSVARSDTGWMTSEVFFEYLTNVFIPELAQERRRQKGLSPEDELILDESDWVVYWLDGYRSHLTMHSSQLCEMNKIALYCFKAHASHICQPNDLGPFKPLKTEWKSAVAEWRLSHPYETLKRPEFATVLHKALQNLTAQSIIAGYRVAGLYPFDPNAVHYDRLTATSAANFDSLAFPLADVHGESDDQISLRCIETILGEEVISAYNSIFSLPVYSPSMIPTIDSYVVWRQLKLNCTSIETSLPQQQIITDPVQEPASLLDEDADIFCSTFSTSAFSMLLSNTFISESTVGNLPCSTDVLVSVDVPPEHAEPVELPVPVEPSTAMSTELLVRGNRVISY